MKNEKGSDDPKSTFYEFGVNTTGFLAGITFAIMILLLENNANLSYFEYLITATAIISILFIVATLGMMRTAAKQMTSDDVLSKFSSAIAGVAFLIFLGLLPAILIQKTFWGGISLIIIEIFVAGFFLKYAKKNTST